MITHEENVRLTQTSAGTPAGELLRRYWHPVAGFSELLREQVMRVRVFGEDLVLYRTPKGDMGLVQERCPHRSASLAYGIPDDDGLRCAYHGWCFNASGDCTSMPYDDVAGGGTFKQRIQIDSYPVQELGGLVFGYFGPQPAPLLPRWDLLVAEDKIREIRVTHLPCNWLQCQENSLDPVHFEWLHARQSNYVAAKAGLPPVMNPVRHLKVDFDLFDHGIMKRRLLEGDDPVTSRDWNVGHPILFPNMLAGGGLQIRVPEDDTHTLHFTYSVRDRQPDEPPQEVVPVTELPFEDEKGRLVVHRIVNQDFSAWIQQGPVTPREQENLAKSDRGILMFRKWLLDNMAKVERGEEPGGLIRDSALNEPFVQIPGMGRERLQALRIMPFDQLEAVLKSAHETIAEQEDAAQRVLEPIRVR
jgi:5,5'-dehydrodivanillate O-demethylase